MLGIAAVMVVTCVAMVLLLLLTPQPAVSRAADIRIGQHQFHVTIAQSKAQRERGLSGRSVLAENEGMLFLFPSEDIYSFWMPDMHFPLDIIWINQNKIVEIARLQAPSADHPTPESYTPSQKADRVVELNAGSTEKFDLHVGDAFSPAV